MGVGSIFGSFRGTDTNLETPQGEAADPTKGGR